MSTYIIIVPASSQEAAIQAGKAYPDASQLTFNVPLSGNGELPATHYWCCGPLAPEQADEFSLAVPDAEVVSWEICQEPSLEEFLSVRNLMRLEPHEDDQSEP